MALRIFVPQPLSDVDLQPLFGFKFAPGAPWPSIFNEPPPPNFFEREVQLVEKPEEAEAVVLPNNFKALDEVSRAYIKEYADVAERVGIPIFVFAFGDLNDGLQFDPRVWTWRLSVYKNTQGPRDIVVPTTAYFPGREVVVRLKGEVPLVSFCGFASFKTTRQWMAYWVKDLLWAIQALFNPVLHARRLGIYWRRRAMEALKRSSKVAINFIIRRTFSGARRTIELAPERARAEYIHSMLESDFVLAPKGDGNYSNRFLEALALGRIPVLIDTDVVLPLEGVVEYEKIIVRVPMREVAKTADYVRTFYDALSDEEWQQRQLLAQQLFKTYLQQDRYFAYFFANIFPILKERKS